MVPASANVFADAGPAINPTLRYTSTQALYEGLLANGNDVGSGSRTVRQLVVERLIHPDCNEGALPVKIGVMTDFGRIYSRYAYHEKFCKNTGRTTCRTTYATGTQEPSCVLSAWASLRTNSMYSDIDLIYIYDQDGETRQCRRQKTAYPTVNTSGVGVKAIYALVGDTTEHGFVFRFDKALRPNGNPGPPVASFGESRKSIFTFRGARRERFCTAQEPGGGPHVDWIGLRANRSGRCLLCSGATRTTTSLKRLRVLHRQIRDHATKRSAGKPERNNDVKLARRYPRDRIHRSTKRQVVAGGWFPSCSNRSTQSASKLPGLCWLDAAGHGRSIGSRRMYFCARWSTASSTRTTSRPVVLPTADPEPECGLVWPGRWAFSELAPSG
ncbi:hypothetical protein [Candidatus Aalborgicola defluviihabitans]|uniref:hypothetical protein n=1 Tax=Candidatus Aalborgicola defluviihabitans TaxID=3386187 RepID=UPI0039B82EE8